MISTWVNDNNLELEQVKVDQNLIKKGYLLKQPFDIDSPSEIYI